MIFSRLVRTSVVVGAAALAACQGNVGNGGLSIPQAAPYGNPQGPGGAPAAASRQHTLDGAVTLAPGTNEIPLPAVDGFAIALELGTPPPSVAPSAAVSASPAARRGTSRASLLGQPAEAATLAPSSPPLPAPSPSPTPQASTPAGGASQAPAAAASGTVASPSPGASAAAKIATKTTVYPNGAPGAPTPKATGDVQTFVKRTAIVRGYVQAAAPISLYGLGAIRFTIPADEAKPGRGFTVAVFEAGRKHHEALVASDAGATFANGVVSATQTDPLVLKKTTGYLILLYGDELPATPAPVASGYSSPGINPFVTPAPNGAPAAPGTATFVPGQPAITPTPFAQ